MNGLMISPIQFMHSQNWDRAFLVSLCMLVSIGLVMVASSSVDFAAFKYRDPWMFVRKQSIFLCLGTLLGLIVLCVPLKFWEKTSGLLLVLGLVLLVLVLLPGIGKVVNGSRRWLAFGPIGIQASEVVKFCLIVFFIWFKNTFLSLKNYGFHLKIYCLLVF